MDVSTQLRRFSEPAEICPPSTIQESSSIRMLGCKQQSADHNAARLQCDINASDIACLMGVGYDSPQKLFRKKTGREKSLSETATPFLMEILQQGQRLEPIALEELSKFINRKIEPGYMWIRHDSGICFGATPDVRLAL